MNELHGRVADTFQYVAFVSLSSRARTPFNIHEPKLIAQLSLSQEDGLVDTATRLLVVLKMSEAAFLCGLLRRGGAEQPQHVVY